MRFQGSGDDLERRLIRHGVEQLSPSPAARKRMRAQVQLAARERLDGRDGPGQQNGKDRRPARRRLLSLLAAASLAVLVAAGAVLAAEPGGPLYPTRLWAETLVGPAGAEAQARAGIQRLDARLDEAAGAVERRDGRAAAAALDAYDSLVDDAVEAAGDDPERVDHLEYALDRHLEFLEQLAPSLPDQARPALERAIERGDRAVDKLAEGSGPGLPAGGRGTRGKVGPSPAPDEPTAPSRTPGKPAGPPGTVGDPASD
jgi:hypothetical protein